MPTTPPQDYRAAHESLAYAVLPRRTQIELTGDDRASFLHNLSTNHIKQLPVGQGCEAFLLNAQGKILFHVFIFATPTALVVETEPGQNERLLAHLDRYHIREKIELHDRTDAWSSLLLIGPQAEEWLVSQGAMRPSPGRLLHFATSIAGQSVWLRRNDIWGPLGIVVVAVPETIAEIEQCLTASHVPQCSADTLSVLRLENGFPVYGLDINEKTLPQEVARDAAAIHFQKGGYIGQETVARIDALGHVNRLLTGVQLAGTEIPPAGAELTHADDVVGHITSAVWSPRLKAPLALAYVRRGHHTPGTQLDNATVVALPLP